MTTRIGDEFTGRDIAAEFLMELEVATADFPGVTRDAYGLGEAIAHASLARYAGRLGLLSPPTSPATSTSRSRARRPMRRSG